MLTVLLISFNTEGLSQEFLLPAEELKAFEGYYQFDKNPDAHLQIRGQGNGLIARQLWDYKEFFILPKSDLEFYSAQEKFPVTFARDSTGKVTQVLVFNRDLWTKVQEYIPRKTVMLSAGRLKEFEGKYTFQLEPGKDEFIFITAKEDHLILKENWSGLEIKFQPSSELEFFSRERAFPLKFGRDSTGTVSHVLAFNRDLWRRVKD